MMRAAHSIKGAARVVGVEPAVSVAHVMEDCFVAAQKKAIALSPGDVDVLLRGVDLLGKISSAMRDPNALAQRVQRSGPGGCRRATGGAQPGVEHPREVSPESSHAPVVPPPSNGDRDRRRPRAVRTVLPPATSEVDDLGPGNPGCGGRRGNSQTVTGRHRLPVLDDPIRPPGNQGPRCSGPGAAGCRAVSSRRARPFVAAIGGCFPPS